FLGYVGEVQIAWVVMAAFAAVAMVGITVGTRLVRFIRQQTLRRAFAVLLLIVGAMILYQNRNVLIPEAEASVHVVEALLR
ncbi:MAG TPA: hypothetical protein VLC48_08715, partial [Gemmatimonadota bacterium]|nr:hypothetical protein [Gemmatimonadota bacterium]